MTDILHNEPAHDPSAYEDLVADIVSNSGDVGSLVGELGLSQVAAGLLMQSMTENLELRNQNALLEGDLMRSEADVAHLANHTASVSDQLFGAKEEARVDDLTGYLNKAAFTDILQTAIDGGDKFVLAFMDLMSLKEINDRFGHQMGDLAITEMTNILAEYLPDVARHIGLAGVSVKIDLARMGGDEFAAIIRLINDPITPEELAEIENEIVTPETILSAQAKGVSAAQIALLQEMQVDQVIIEELRHAGVSLPTIALSATEIIQNFIHDVYIPNSKIPLKERGLAMGVITHDPSNPDYIPRNAKELLDFADTNQYYDKARQRETLGVYDRITGERRGGTDRRDKDREEDNRRKGFERRGAADRLTALLSKDTSVATNLPEALK